jgi:hypothetical protein
MGVAAATLSLLLAASSASGGIAKLAGTRAMRAGARRLGFAHTTYRLIGGLELSAATGLLIGLFLATQALWRSLHRQHAKCWVACP